MAATALQLNYYGEEGIMIWGQVSVVSEARNSLYGSECYLNEKQVWIFFTYSKQYASNFGRNSMS